MQTPLLTVIREIVAAAGVADQFENDLEFSLHIENGPYMPLVIEAFRAPDALTPGHTRSISIAHYREENDDLIADPEILMTQAGELIFLQSPLYFAPIRRRADDGTLIYSYGRDMDTCAFARQWARNIRAQGFIAAARRLRTTQGSV